MMLLILYYRYRWENISQTMWYLRQLTGLVSFFSWQIVYQKARQATAISTVPHCSSPHPLCSVIPTLGPLYVDLNAVRIFF